jgi:hypothetical protein
MHPDGIVLLGMLVDHEQFGILHLENDVKRSLFRYSSKLRREFL